MLNHRELETFEGKLATYKTLWDFCFQHVTFASMVDIVEVLSILWLPKSSYRHCVEILRILRWLGLARHP